MLLLLLAVLTISLTTNFNPSHGSVLRENVGIGRQEVLKGFCHHPCMEKEATFDLNPRTSVKLKEPVLKSKAIVVRHHRKQIRKFLIEKTSPKCASLIAAYCGNESVEHEVLRTTAISEIPCTCQGEECVALQRVLPVGANTERVICYNSCTRTLYAAFKRQLKRVSEPDPVVIAEFQAFCEDYFVKYVEPHLRNFDYSYTQWFNCMPRHKQEAILRVDPEYDGDEVVFGLFCKREKQIFGGKNRAIANISQEVKNIMGPVCWALEDLADKYFPGYCGKKSWSKLEAYLDQAYAEGYTTALQGDGSGFDLSQHAVCKYIDYRIYNYLADKKLVHHVDPELFRRVATAETRKIEAMYSSGKSLRPFASARINGTVFSGSSDTTLMNTLRMALYNMFTLSKMGLHIEQDYRLLAKGDDFMVLTRRTDVDYELNYYKYWCTKDQGEKTNYRPYGIGQILKFLIIGDFSTIDFCSTTVIPYAGGTKFKMARKPERMSPLAHYSRAALRMSRGQLKQYLYDQADSIDMCMPQMPFYREYAEAFRYWGDQIDAEPERAGAGRPRLFMEHDGHRLIQTNKGQLVDMYERYGADFIYQAEIRQSEVVIPEADVLQHLLVKYGITETDIAIHKDFLINGGYYDHMASILQNPPK